MAAMRERNVLALDEPLAVEDSAILEEVARVFHHNIVRACIGLVARLVESEEALRRKARISS
eukprot:5794342-Prymnesium_polylepis.1